MPITSEVRDDGIRVVTMDQPPVNALTVQGWFDLAGALDDAGRDPDTHVVVLRAEGTRLQRRRGHQGDAGHRAASTP